MTENINWNEVETDTGYSLIPNGDYLAELESVKQESIKDTDSPNYGKPLYKCQFTITDNRQNGRKVFINFTESDKSKSRVKALAIATKTALVGSIYQVLLNSMGKEFIANVGVSRGNEGYQDSNTIWQFKPAPVANHQPVNSTPQPIQPIPQPRETALCQSTGKPIYKGADGNWYYEN